MLQIGNKIKIKTSIDYKLLYTINYNMYCNLISLQLKLAL